MPEQAQAIERFIRRLAEGTRRTRLIDPVLAARPPLVMVTAPSGYGKTVLTAQVASSESFGAVYWVRGSGDGISAEESLGTLADLIRGIPISAGVRSSLEHRRECHEALASVSDDCSVLAVFDDADWAGDAEALVLIDQAMAEAPLGSVAIVSTRVGAPDAGIMRRVWTIGAEQLSLTDPELSEVWAKYTGSVPREDVVRELAAATGRHAALLSLMGRNASLMGYSTVPPDPGASVASLVNVLATTQLRDDECNLLDYAGVLGEGEVLVLARLCPGLDVSQSIERISRVLPLVSVSGSGTQERFMVHDLVAEARGSAALLGQRDPAGLAEVAEVLADDGRFTRALEVVSRSGRGDLLVSFLGTFGSQMLRTSSWEATVRSINGLQSAAIASDARLLAVKAESDWITGKRSQAIQEAQLAMRIEELANPATTSPATRSLLAGMRMIVGDFAGIAADVTQLLDRGVALDDDAMAEVLYAAIPAYAFQGDRAAFSRCVEKCSLITGGGTVSPFRLSRLNFALALVADIVEGDPHKSVRLFRRSMAQPDAPSHGTAGTHCNMAVAYLDGGDTDGAAQEVSDAIQCLGECCTPLDRGLTRVVGDSIKGILGGNVDVRLSTEEALIFCESEGERFTLVLTCLMGSQVALSVRESKYARALSERGLATAMETASPVLTWFAELVQAFACLAVDDVDRARVTATRILPQVEAISAMALVLHARLILAQSALCDDDLALAVQHLSAVADHIIEKSPALVVACYLRAFPGMLGPLALAMGVDAVPIRVLNLLNGEYEREALDAAAAVLTKPELKRLKTRMRREAQRIAARERAANDENAVCEVRLFGGLSVKAPHGVVGERDWVKRKARLLFAMLVSRGGTDVPRGEIIEYLWPDMDEERGLSNFYVVWSAMKRALSPGGVRETVSPFIEHTGGVCRVVSERIVSDLDLFRTALGRARAAHVATDSAAELSALLEALELYRGDILPGDVYDDWFGPVRERFKHDYEDAALRAGRLYADSGEPLEGLSILRDASLRSPWREDLYQSILRLQIATGQRAAAVETYLLCRSRLVEDLGIDPSRETTALYEQVLGMSE